jgi:NAD(P)H-hydrate epimerase
VEIFLLSHPSRIKSKESRANWEVLQKINMGFNSLKIRIIEDSSSLEGIELGFKEAELRGVGLRGTELRGIGLRGAELRGMKIKEAGLTGDVVLVDALLGTGIKGKLREPVSSAIDIINNSKGVKIAVDVPSGLDPLTGYVEDKVVKADFTVTFHKPKTGLKKARREYVGNIQVCDIGIPPEAELCTGPGDLLRLKKRDKKSHKGQNGRVLVLGGSKNYSGAPALAALASLRSGADLALVACPAVVSSAIRSYSPDLIVNSLLEDLSGDFLLPQDVDEVLKLSKSVGSLVIGCGMGGEDETAVALCDLMERVVKPVVIDADAFKLLDPDLIKKAENEMVLTPHSAEFKSLFGLDVPPDLEGRMEMVQEAAGSSGSTVLLKGAVDIISNGRKIRLNSTGNPGMTVGGTGDCLAGLVGGLMAQGHDGFEAAFLGAFLNGKAGDLAAERYGYNFTATDLLRFIPRAFSN